MFYSFASIFPSVSVKVVRRSHSLATQSLISPDIYLLFVKIGFRSHRFHHHNVFTLYPFDFSGGESRGNG